MSKKVANKKAAKGKGAKFAMPKGLKGQEAVKKKIIELTTALIEKSEKTPVVKPKTAAPAKKTDITALAKAVENKTPAKSEKTPAVKPKNEAAKNGKTPLAQQPEQVALRKQHPTAFAGVVYAVLETAKQTLSVNEIMQRAGIDRENRAYVSSLITKLVEARLVTTEERECSISGRTVRCVILRSPKKEEAS